MSERERGREGGPSCVILYRACMWCVHTPGPTLVTCPPSHTHTHVYARAPLSHTRVRTSPLSHTRVCTSLLARTYTPLPHTRVYLLCPLTHMYMQGTSITHTHTYIRRRSFSLSHTLTRVCTSLLARTYTPLPHTHTCACRITLSSPDCKRKPRQTHTLSHNYKAPWRARNRSSGTPDISRREKHGV